MLKVIITGGAGFIGSHVTDELVKRNYKCFVVDDLSGGREENINNKTIFIKKDICSMHISALFKKIKPEIIIHLAAQTSISSSYKNPKKDIDTNLIGTLNILESSKSFKPKIIFASSAAVYDPYNQLPIEEGSKKNPVSIYGTNKLCAENLLEIYNKQYKIPFTILRFSNVYGERQNSTAEGGVVAIFFKNILEQKPVTIYNTGRQTRDFIYVSDIVAAISRILENDIEGIFNIASGRQISINNLYQKISKISNLKSTINRGERAYFEVEKSALSIAKIKKESGWGPKVNLDKGLQNTYNYFERVYKRK